MTRPLVLALVVSVAAIVTLVLTREPEGPFLAAALVALGVGAASAASLVLLRTAQAGRSARARSSRARAVRRGAELGAVLALVAGLQVIGGLTPLTVLFVVLSFAIAEYVLSAGTHTSR